MGFGPLLGCPYHAGMLGIISTRQRSPGKVVKINQLRIIRLLHKSQLVHKDSIRINTKKSTDYFEKESAPESLDLGLGLQILFNLSQFITLSYSDSRSARWLSFGYSRIFLSTKVFIPSIFHIDYVSVFYLRLGCLCLTAEYTIWVFQKKSIGFYFER